MKLKRTVQWAFLASLIVPVTAHASAAFDFTPHLSADGKIKDEAFQALWKEHCDLDLQKVFSGTIPGDQVSPACRALADLYAGVDNWDIRGDDLKEPAAEGLISDADAKILEQYFSPDVVQEIARSNNVSELVVWANDLNRALEAKNITEIAAAVGHLPNALPTSLRQDSEAIHLYDNLWKRIFPVVYPIYEQTFPAILARKPKTAAAVYEDLNHHVQDAFKQEGLGRLTAADVKANLGCFKPEGITKDERKKPLQWYKRANMYTYLFWDVWNLAGLLDTIEPLPASAGTRQLVHFGFTEAVCGKGKSNRAMLDFLELFAEYENIKRAGHLG